MCAVSAGNWALVELVSQGNLIEVLFFSTSWAKKERNKGTKNHPRKAFDQFELFCDFAALVKYGLLCPGQRNSCKHSKGDEGSQIRGGKISPYLSNSSGEAPLLRDT